MEITLLVYKSIYGVIRIADHPPARPQEWTLLYTFTHTVHLE